MSPELKQLEEEITHSKNSIKQREADIQNYKNRIEEINKNIAEEKQFLIGWLEKKIKMLEDSEH